MPFTLISSKKVSSSRDTLRAAILFVSYGPYHLARAKALLRVPGVEPFFIELSSVEQKYEWEADKREFGDRLVTAVDVPYESCSKATISRAVKRLLDRLQPGVVAIAGYSEPGMRAAASWARRNNAGLVLMGDSVEWGAQRRWWLEILKRWWIHRYVHAGFVAGTASRDYQIKLGIPPERIWSPYDVVDNDFFACESHKITAAADEHRSQLNLPREFFLFVGRLVHEKNLPILLRGYAAYRVRTKAPWPLYLIGDGPMRQELALLSRELGEAGIVWLGSKRQAELPQYLSLASALVLPSKSETWGLVVNEAMASGIPVLVSKNCGCSVDLVHTGKTGFTFEPVMDAISDALTRFSNMPAGERAQMGQASRTLITKYSTTEFAHHLARALRSTVLDVV